MPYPTRHWRKFTGTLLPGARVTLTHGLQETGITAITPDGVHPDMDSGVYTQEANANIGCYQASTTQYVYLSNFSPQNTRYYGVIVRHYHTTDDANI